MLKSRIEQLCSKALQQQQQQTQLQHQQQNQGQQAPSAPHQLADKLLGLLEQEQQAVTAAAEQQQQLQAQLNAAAFTAAAGMGAQQPAQVYYAADDAETLNKEASKLQQQPWHQKLRQQLLQKSDEVGLGRPIYPDRLTYCCCRV